MEEDTDKAPDKWDTSFQQNNFDGGFDVKQIVKENYLPERNSLICLPSSQQQQQKGTLGLF